MDEQEKNSKMKIASNLVWKKMPIKYKAITIVIIWKSIIAKSVLSEYFIKLYILKYKLVK